MSTISGAERTTSKFNDEFSRIGWSAWHILRVYVPSTAPLNVILWLISVAKLFCFDIFRPQATYRPLASVSNCSSFNSLDHLFTVTVRVTWPQRPWRAAVQRRISRQTQRMSVRPSIRSSVLRSSRPRTTDLRRSFPSTLIPPTQPRRHQRLYTGFLLWSRPALRQQPPRIHHGFTARFTQETARTGTLFLHWSVGNCVCIQRKNSDVSRPKTSNTHEKWNTTKNMLHRSPYRETPVRLERWQPDIQSIKNQPIFLNVVTGWMLCYQVRMHDPRAADEWNLWQNKFLTRFLIAPMYDNFKIWNTTFDKLFFGPSLRRLSELTTKLLRARNRIRCNVQYIFTVLCRLGFIDVS